MLDIRKQPALYEYDAPSREAALRRLEPSNTLRGIEMNMIRSTALELTHEDMERYDRGIEQFNKRMREQEMERMKEGAQAANKHQIGGDHYMKAIQPWDYIAANQLGYFEGNVVKYVTRWKDKGGVSDLMKAKHYIEKLIELETGK